MKALLTALAPSPSAEFDALKESLENAELQVEDLKIQLDDALGAEDMLELLTEKNLAMGEVRRSSPSARPASSLTCALSPRSPQKIEEQRIAIEDLEALRELNDELEENHLETEKQLQEEIGASCLPPARGLQHEG